MSSQEHFKAGGDDVFAVVPHPACPQCRRRMVIRQISPVLFASDVDDVLYGCETCGTEFKRGVTRR